MGAPKVLEDAACLGTLPENLGCPAQAQVALELLKADVVCRIRGHGRAAGLKKPWILPKERNNPHKKRSLSAGSAGFFEKSSLGISYICPDFQIIMLLTFNMWMFVEINCENVACIQINCHNVAIVTPNKCMTFSVYMYIYIYTYVCILERWS